MGKRYINENVAKELFDEYLNDNHRGLFQSGLLHPFNGLVPSRVLKRTDICLYDELFEEWLDERELHCEEPEINLEW